MREEISTNLTKLNLKINQQNPHARLNPISSNISMKTTRVSSADEYYHIYMLGINNSKGLTDLGPVKIDLLLCLISIFILMYICIRHGVKSTGKHVD